MVTQYAAHINDAGITLLRGDQIVYREPGFALLDDARLTTGNDAFSSARINPRRVQHRYWAELTTAPLSDQRFRHLSAADLASRQLEQMWSKAGERESGSLVLAVPPSMDAANLGLLLGSAAEIGLPVAALVDAAVAATRRQYRNAVPVHVDISLHATTLTRLSQAGQVQVERVEVLRDCGLYALYDAWINAIAEVFVKQSRFDPLHIAETEQMLLDNLAGWLSSAASRDRVDLELRYGGLQHKAEIESLALIGAAAPWYQQISSKLRALFRADETPAIQVTDRIARLPGLADLLRARVGGELFTLAPGATSRGALSRCREKTAAGGRVSLRRQLPWDQAATDVVVEPSYDTRAGVPTHLLFRARAWAIGDEVLDLGSRQSDSRRTIVVDSEMPGISRRHCSLRLINAQCVLEDHSRYGTFLNGHRIDGSTVLEVGDSIRIGSPGYEFQVITTDENLPHGT
ncbi:MAG TPA: FHA domain-containing protein [Woeseiaceae bacterium]|nr:FHA domain-containing protein [Woeseiaceae bacterium]